MTDRTKICSATITPYLNSGCKYTTIFIYNKRPPESQRAFSYLWFLESEFLEEVVTFVINEDECREVLNVDLPDRLHSKLWILYALDALDVVLCENRSRTTDRTEVESALLVASVSNALCTVTLCEHHHTSAVALEKVNV